MKREKKPTEGRIAFEFVSPNGIPDGDELHVSETGALTLKSCGLWSVIGSENAEEMAIEVLKARGKWFESHEQTRQHIYRLQEALRMARREITEHNHKYRHTTNPQKLQQIDDALRGYPVGQLELFT